MIEGNLVRLRPLDPSDVERFLVWMNDGEVRRYLDARYPVSRPAEEEFVRRAATAKPPPEWSLAIDTLDGRHIGAIGQRKTPGRVFKNKKNPGHKGVDRVTTQNLEVVDVIADSNLVLIRGAVPGHKNGLVFIRPSIKAQKAAAKK